MEDATIRCYLNAMFGMPKHHILVGVSESYLNSF